jgi:hypothetical protein
VARKRAGWGGKRGGKETFSRNPGKRGGSGKRRGIPSPPESSSPWPWMVTWVLPHGKPSSSRSWSGMVRTDRFARHRKGLQGQGGRQTASQALEPRPCICQAYLGINFCLTNHGSPDLPGTLVYVRERILSRNSTRLDTLRRVQSCLVEFSGRQRVLVYSGDSLIRKTGWVDVAVANSCHAERTVVELSLKPGSGRGARLDLSEPYRYNPTPPNTPSRKGMPPSREPNRSTGPLRPPETPGKP